MSTERRTVPTLPLVVLAKEPSPTRVNIRLEQKKEGIVAPTPPPDVKFKVLPRSRRQEQCGRP